jgi:PHD/YefM family antitoxin component YafN of YafNO toxin-antitoxin module
LDDEDEYNAIQEQLNEAKKPSAGAKLAQQKEVFLI